MLECFTFAKDGPITTITFNRPERLNCMNRQVMIELEGLIKDVRDDRDTRILIVTGTGRAFSAGADMSAAKGITDPAERKRLFTSSNRGVARMVGRSFDQITAARLHDDLSRQRFRRRRRMGPRRRLRFHYRRGRSRVLGS